MTPFFKHAEPTAKATAIRLYNDEDEIKVPLDLLPYLFFQFSKEGKRLYEDDGVDSFVFFQDQGYSYQFKHVTRIEVV